MRTIERKSILEAFLNKHIVVDIERYRVSGKLLSFQESDKSSHKPVILLIENAKGLHIVRGNWRSVREDRLEDRMLK